MSKILVIAEHAEGKLNAGLAKALAAAQKIGGEIDVAVLAADGSSVAAEAAKLDGVTRVLQVDNAANAHPVAVVLAPQIVELAGRGYSHILFPGTTTGKDIAPRVAAKLGVPQVSDVMAVEGAHTFKRPIYAGNAIVTVEAPADKTLVATVRTASYAAAGAGVAAPHGRGVISLVNPKGVVLELTGRQKGLLVNIDLSGMAISLK